MKKPRDLPKGKKPKPMDSDEDDEVPRNEPGTSSNTQPPVPASPLQSGSTSSSHGPSTSTASTSSQRTSTSTSSEEESADNDDDHGEGESGPAIQSARSQGSGRTVLYPDLYVLTNDEHWTLTPEAHKYAAAAKSFCFVTTENGEQQDIYNLTTIPGVQRSLCLKTVTDDSSSELNSQTEWTIKPETCWSKSQNPVHEKKHQPRKYEDNTSSLLKRNTLCGNPGLTMRFLTSLI